MVTFGLYPPRWARSEYPKLTGVGMFDSWSFDPLSWKPNYPNPAFLLMDREDAFWAAKQVAAFSDDEIRALVETGEYSDPRAADWITECLIKRRDKIAEAWFSRVLPLDKFSIVDGKLAFEDLGAGRDPRRSANTPSLGEWRPESAARRHCRTRAAQKSPPLQQRYAVSGGNDRMRGRR